MARLMFMLRAACCDLGGHSQTNDLPMLYIFILCYYISIHLHECSNIHRGLSIRGITLVQGGWPARLWHFLLHATFPA